MDKIDSPRRPIRTRRHNRRSYGEERKPPKRLFTPEIKRFLKDWLIRRRDNPYPNRDEKKTLAVQTGLTYIQVCNWFANWRRKLKNAGKQPQRTTWGNLIKTYNSQAQGNVEQFSICSDDSIWEDTDSPKQTYESSPTVIDHCYSTIQSDGSITDIFIDKKEANPFSTTNKYKNHIMEKYLRDLTICHQQKNDDNLDSNQNPVILSKWLESAANFRPSQKNYVYWSSGGMEKKRNRKNFDSAPVVRHGREELDAAEALTRLANASLGC